MTSERYDEWNIFELYPADPRAKIATAEIKALCDDSIKKIQAVTSKHAGAGATDSETIRYIVEYLYAGVRK